MLPELWLESRNFVVQPFLRKRAPGALARKSQLCSTAVVKETCPRGPPNGAGFEYGQENIYFRIGLVLAILKVVFPDLGLPKQIFIIRETFINRGNGLISLMVTPPRKLPPGRWTCGQQVLRPFAS